MGLITVNFIICYVLEPSQRTNIWGIELVSNFYGYQKNCLNKCVTIKL